MSTRTPGDRCRRADVQARRSELKLNPLRETRVVVFFFLLLILFPAPRLAIRIARGNRESFFFPSAPLYLPSDRSLRTYPYRVFSLFNVVTRVLRRSDRFYEGFPDRLAAVYMFAADSITSAGSLEDAVASTCGRRSLCSRRGREASEKENN